MSTKKPAQSKIIKKQREYFKSGETRNVDFRINKLKDLKDVIKEFEEDIYRALLSDFRKPVFETYASEIGIILEEIKYFIRNLKSWAKPARVRTTVVHFPSSSYIHYEPHGVALIISPWNYPFQLIMSPLIGAIAAGNVVSVKTSELTPNTSRIVKKVLKNVFRPEYVSVFEGGVQVSKSLLGEKFDYIFYTGSTAVGKVVMEAASKNLTPVTLELGGKSPCIVDKSANIDVSAKRIAWGKFFNGGQSCVAPDYLLVHRDIKTELVNSIIESIEKFYGEDIESSENFCRIVNDRHFMRLKRLIDKEKVIYGGRTVKKTRYIEPTLIDKVALKDPVMSEEIFGPILPIIEFSKIDEAIRIVESMDKPLALYLFSTDKGTQNRIIREVSFGGGCINDTMVHVANNELPFGGVGPSGIGTYHGKASFITFSNTKSILKKSSSVDVSLRYPPYDRKKLDLIKKILK